MSVSSASWAKVGDCVVILGLKFDLSLNIVDSPLNNKLHKIMAIIVAVPEISGWRVLILLLEFELYIPELVSVLRVESPITIPPSNQPQIAIPISFFKKGGKGEGLFEILSWK